MPIYPYRCTACGFETEVMRKVSDPRLTTCPKCSSEHFVKQLTAPGFQLKGTGWYATDFKGGAAKPSTEPTEKAPDSTTDNGSATPAAAAKETGTTATPAAAPTPAPAAPSSSPAT